MVQINFKTMKLMSSAAVIVIDSQQYLIMLDHLTFNSRRSSFLSNAESSQLQQRVVMLEEQIYHLNKIIAEKDQALDEIREAFISSKNNITHFIDKQLQHLQTYHPQFSLSPEKKIAQQTEKIKTFTEAVLRDLERILSKSQDKQVVTLTANKYFSVVKDEKEQERQSNDTSLDQQRHRRIYQVPVEIEVFQEIHAQNLQDEFEPSRSYVYEVPIQFCSIEEIPVELGTQQIYQEEVIQHQRRIYELEVQIDQVFEIAGELNQFTQFPVSFLSNDYQDQPHIFEVPKQPKNIMMQNAKLNHDLHLLIQEITALKQANQRLSLQKEKIKLVQVPIEVIRLVETPIQLQPFQVSYVQAHETNPIQTNEFSTQTEASFQPFQEPKHIIQKEIILRQVPIEVVIQKLVEIPTQVVIQKTVEVVVQKIVEVEKIKIRQTPIQVIIEKQIFIEVEKLVPILVPIIKQVPIEVEMQVETIQIEKIVPIFVPIIKQVPIQVEMPVQIIQFVDVQIIREVKTLVQVPVLVFLQAEKSTNLNELQSYSSESESNSKLPEQSNYRSKQIQVVYDQQAKVQQKCKIFELPIEVEIQRIVEVQRVVEGIVEKEVIVEKIVQVIVQKVVEVQKIVEIEVIKEVFVERIKEIPIECVLEVPTYIEKPLEIVQEEKQQAVDLLAKVNPDAQIGAVSLTSRIPEEIVLEYMMNRKMQEYVIVYESEDYVGSENEKEVIEITLQLPFYNQKKQGKDGEVQTQLSYTDVATQTETFQNTQKPKKGLIIYELPIQLEMVQNQRAQQLRFQQCLNFTKEKLQDEIRQLHVVIEQMERIVRQKQIETQLLSEKIEVYALGKSEIQTKYYHQTTKYQQSLLQMSQKFEKQVQKNRSMQNTIQRLEKELLSTENIKSSTHIYQLPIEVEVMKEFNDQQMQTQDIDVFQNIQFIEVAVEIENQQEITQLQIENDEEEELFEQFLQPIQEQENLNPIEGHGFRKIQSELFQSNHNQKDQYLEKLQQVAQTYPQIYEIPVEIIRLPENYEQENEETDEKMDYEPEVYEIPVQIKLLVQSDDVQVQTSFEIEKVIENRIYEVPVQFQAIELDSDVQNLQQSILKLEGKVDLNNINKVFSLQNIVSMTIEPQKLSSRLQLKSKTNQFKISTDESSFIAEDREVATARIYQVPIQMNIVMNQTQYNVLEFGSQTQYKKLRIINREVQYQQTFTVAKEKLETPPKQRQRKLQNQIVRLGSDITVNLQNSSQVQSLTPGGLFNSLQSQYKFPTPQINNISLIKKDSMSECKFFGSLDMRQALQSREDPIASLRLQNKRLQGFEQESSDGDSHNSRQMIIQQNQTIGSKDINRIQTPNLDPHDLNFSQYANLQAKHYIEQEQHSYNEQNEILNTKMNKLKQQVEQYKRKIEDLEEDYENQREDSQKRLEKVNRELMSSKRQIELLKQQIEKNKCLLQENEQAKTLLKKQNEILVQNCEKYKYDAKRQEKEVSREIQRLQILIEEKKAEVKDAKLQTIHNKHLHEQQLNEMKQYLESNKEEIQKLYEQIQEKNEKVDQLQAALQEMRKNITLMKHLQTDASAIYQQEFERIRCDFQVQKRQKQAIIQELHNQILRLKAQLSNQQSKWNQQCQINEQLQKRLEEMRQEYSQLHHLKSQVEDNSIATIKQLKIQIQLAKQQLLEKEEQLNKQMLLQNYSERIEQISSKVKIQYLQTNVSKSSESDITSLQQYCKKLQSIILKYEEKLAFNHQTIQELQEKVCQYLHDALEKEQQAENLYLKLIQFENTINNLLIEKVTLEIENRKLSKSIEQAEKKLKLLGNRLIEVARQRAQYESGDDDDYQE